MGLDAWIFGILVLLGHSLLVIFLHNRFYSLAVDHKTTDRIQLVHFLWLCLGPIALWFLWSGQVPSPQTTDPEWFRALLWGLAAVGLIGPPLDIYLRSKRRQMTPDSSCSPLQTTQANHPSVYVGPGIWGRIAQLPGNRSLYPVLERSEVPLVGLPLALDGLTILHLSDLHIKKTPNSHFFESVAEGLATLEPDLICLTGDLVEKGGMAHAEVFRSFLMRLRFREAGLAILGNHDFWHPTQPTLNILKDLGYQHLGNKRGTLRIRDTNVSLWGLEYPWNSELPEGWKQPFAEWTLCLSHTPDHFSRFARLGKGLMLAGHVHGGQIRLPLFGPVIMPSVHGRTFDQGWFRRKNAYLHVSQGLGGGHPIRFGCSPGASLITLKASKET